MTRTIVLAAALISGSRILALCRYYHAPQEVAFHFETVELPRVLNITGLIPPPPPILREGDEKRPIDMTPIKDLNITLCVGKEWYRFPSHWLILDGIRVVFIKSNFDGLLPRHFEPSPVATGLWPREATRNIPAGLNDLNKEEISHYVRSDFTPRFTFTFHVLRVSHQG